MELMQFSAVLLIASLTIKLLILPKRAVNSFKVCRSRWLLTAGSALLAIQFLLQYTLGLRNHNVSAAVMLNVAFFVPCSALFSLSVINLQRQGFLSRQEKYIFIPVWILAIILMLFGIRTGQSSGIFWTEIAASALYAAMQSYYSFHQIRYMKMIRHALANYYDRDMDSVLRWMKLSIFFLPVVGLFIPLIVFFQGPWLAVFSLVILGGVFFFIDGFCSYVVSKGPARMQEAEDEGNEEEAQTVMMEDLRKTADSERRASMPLDTENLRRVDRAVEQWVSQGQYRNNGLKLPQVADELNVPRYLLTGWLRSQHMKYADWMNSLRVNEAKRVMREHPDWNNEAIAQHCGFCDRSYFLRKFKEATGMSPNEYTTIHTT